VAALKSSDRTAAAHAFLTGGGKMGALKRAFD
jgi:hypothetical protein